ncbi:MAG: SLC13 family permease [Eubacteriales bacterium]|jgi:Na+/H+ antiporter NhaD/arsenite permease-like protein
MSRVAGWLKQEPVLSVSLAAALLTACWVPPSLQYLSYLDTGTLILLFSLMAVVAGFSRMGALDWLAHTALARVHTLRGLGRMLVLLCFFSSMLLTNDVSLLAFVPFAILLLSMVRGRRHLIWVICAQTVAANLGSALTPVGNPQNLYLYSHYQLTPGAFFAVTIPLCLLGLAVCWALCWALPDRPLEIHTQRAPLRGTRWHVLCWSILLLLCLCTVFRVMPHPLLLIIVLAAVLLLDRDLLRHLDYGLLLTFVCFFVFVGNVQNIPAVSQWVSSILQGREFWCGVLFSQVISNVPAAVMLSAFTQQGLALVAGTNIGGLGTLVGSLASLISFRLYCGGRHVFPRRYLLIFSAVNFSLLALFCLFYQLCMTPFL